MAFTQAMRTPAAEDPRLKAIEVNHDDLQNRVTELVKAIGLGKFDAQAVDNAHKDLDEAYKHTGKQEARVIAQLQSIARSLATALNQQAKKEELDLGESETEESNQKSAPSAIKRGYRGMVLKAVGLDPREED